MAHALMHLGTTVDVFLRENLEWLGKATNWAKFTATASIGVIHKGHHKQSLKLLEPYLPREGQAASPYQVRVLLIGSRFQLLLHLVSCYLLVDNC
jgi:26S proteasome regulatory subunit N2